VKPRVFKSAKGLWCAEFPCRVYLGPYRCDMAAFYNWRSAIHAALSAVPVGMR
jgi:hypothetical protein